MRVLFQTFTQLVNVFFIMNTLSTIFVHCLSRDGIFPNLKKSQFCNFSPHFPPHALPHENPTFSSFQGSTPTATFPLILPRERPYAPPFRGDSSQPTFPFIFSRILPISTPSRGITPGRFQRESMGITPEYSQFLK